MIMFKEDINTSDDLVFFSHLDPMKNSKIKSPITKMGIASISTKCFKELSGITSTQSSLVLMCIVTSTPMDCRSTLHSALYSVAFVCAFFNLQDQQNHQSHVHFGLIQWWLVHTFLV